MTPEIQSRLGNLLEMNEEKYQNFRKHRLIICDVAIMATIKNIALNLPSTFDSAGDKACIRKIQEKKEEKSAKRAYLSFPYRDFIDKECFQYEVTEFPSSFTDDGKIYHSKKLDSPNKFRKTQGAVVELVKSDGSAIAFDLSVVINALANRK